MNESEIFTINLFVLLDNKKYRKNNHQNSWENINRTVYNGYISGGGKMDYMIFLKAMYDYIENRVTEELKVEEVAEEAGFSLSTLDKRGLLVSFIWNCAPMW